MDEISGNTQERFFIVCAGRTGSTLLAATLGDAGAEFAMPVLDDWSTGTGDMEHQAIQRATHHLYQAYRICPEKPLGRIQRYRWDLHRHHAKKKIKGILKQARYVKSDNLDLAVHPSFQQGYFPRVILNYRQFEHHAISLFQMRGHSSIDWLSDIYCRVYRNGLALLFLYGGCVVPYNDLVDTGHDGWAEALEGVTGLSAGTILESRAKRSKGGGEAAEYPVMDRAGRELFEAMEGLKGRVIPASPQALRSWRARKS
ncbi:MAG: hypothetical protein QGF09_14020 [Rhodospirillales bacterium]|jgi:hypothetical protein|nr:hypothetical protein [Rhodospirillales bacterium]